VSVTKVPRTFEEEWLPGIASTSCVVARSDHVVLFVDRVSAFPDAVRLTLTARIRRTIDADASQVA
jgi:hypothetical protein